MAQAVKLGFDENGGVSFSSLADKTGVVLAFSNGVPHWKATGMAGVGGTANIWVPAVGKKFRLLHFTITADTAGTYHIADNGTYIYSFALAANQVATIMLPLNGILSAAANNPLQIVYPAVTGNVWVTAVGNEE